MSNAFRAADIPRKQRRFTRSQAVLWVFAVAFFVVGDVGTTLYGLEIAGATEGHPVSAVVLQSFGLFGMLGAKALVVITCLALSKLPDHPAVAASSPTVLIVFGAFLTTWNTLVILALA